MVKHLREIMGTSYVCDWQSDKLRKALEEALKEGITIDIAGCFFTNGSRSQIDIYSRKMRIINSEDSVKDGILEHNSNLESDRVFQRYRSTFEGLDDVMSYLKGLSSEYVVDVPTTATEARAFPILDLIFILRPDVPVRMGSIIVEYFKHVRAEWNYWADDSHEYWELKETTPIKVDAIDGKCFSITSGVSYEEALYKRLPNVLPYRFGTECLKNEGDFKKLVGKALDYLKATAKPRKKTLMDVLEIGDD